MAAHRGDVAPPPALGPSSPLVDVFDALAATFATAVAGRGVIEHQREVAGRAVLFRFAGSALVERMLDAFNHLPAGSGRPALTVSVWDTKSTGTRLPDSPLIPSQSELTTGPLYRSGDLTFLLQCGERSMSSYDAVAGAAYHCLPDADLPVWHRAAPMRSVLSWWMPTHGCQLVHSAAVGDGSGAVLLTGPGGSGKSTTALTCATAGLRYLGDDYVAIEPALGLVHPVYRTAKLDGRHRDRHPALLPTFEPGREGEKALGYLDASREAHTVRAVVLPRVTGGTTSLRPTSPGRALLALAPATVLQLPGDAASRLRAMRAMLDGLPAYDLALGDDLEVVPGLLRSLLRAP